MSMSLLKDVYTLVTQGALQFTYRDTWKELSHVLSDLTFGARRSPKDPSFIYTDLHAHFPRTASLKEIITEASKRVDVLAITGRTSHNEGHLDFEDLPERLEKESVSYENIGSNKSETYN